MGSFPLCRAVLCLFRFHEGVQTPDFNDRGRIKHHIIEHIHMLIYSKNRKFPATTIDVSADNSETSKAGASQQISPPSKKQQQPRRKSLPAAQRGVYDRPPGDAGVRAVRGPGRGGWCSVCLLGAARVHERWGRPDGCASQWHASGPLRLQGPAWLHRRCTVLLCCGCAGVRAVRAAPGLP